MSKQFFLFIFITFLYSDTFSQKEDYNWIFGSINIADYDNNNSWGEVAIPTVLTFNTDPPSWVQNKEITLDFGLSNAIYSNSEGEIMLYCNGMSMHGQNHRPIIDGDTIAFNSNWSNFVSINNLGLPEPLGFNFHNGVVIFPTPEDEDRLYVIYINNDESNLTNLSRRTLVAEVDINESKLLYKDKNLDRLYGTSNINKCVQHANGRDWWLYQNALDTMFVYLVDPQGIKKHHEQVLPFSLQLRKGGGSAYSPQGDQLAIYRYSIDSIGSEFILMDIDRCSGDISNPKIKYLQDEEIGFFTNGVEYSASGRYLYRADFFNVYQYDTWEDDIYNTEQIVMQWDSTYSERFEGGDPRPNHFNMMQRGPDNKIYISGGTQGFYIHVIHEPDQPGELCRAEPTAIKLPTFYFTTMPNFNTLRLGPIDGSGCDTLGLNNLPVSRFRYEQDSMDYLAIDFVDLSYYEPSSWVWDFGDGHTSIDRYPSHVYNEDAAYQVCLTVSNEYSTDVTCDTLYLGVSSLIDTHKERNISVFPNPVQDVTRIVFHDYLPRDAGINIYSLEGQLILKKALSGTASLIDLTGVSTGIYVYEIYDGDTLIKSGKIVKVD